jgi:tetratricopeptide (TPR) repeat protein
MILSLKRFMGLTLLIIGFLMIQIAIGDNATTKNLSAINESDTVTWFNKGKVLFDSGKYNESIKCFDNAIENEGWDIGSVPPGTNTTTQFIIDNRGLARNNLSYSGVIDNISVLTFGGSIGRKDLQEKFFDVQSGTSRISADMRDLSGKGDIAFLLLNPEEKRVYAAVGSETTGSPDVVRPEPGKWRLWIYGNNVPTDHNESFSINVTRDGKNWTWISAKGPESIPYGSIVVINATLNIPKNATNEMLKGFIEINSVTPFSIPVKVNVDEKSTLPVNATTKKTIKLSNDSEFSQTWSYKGIALSKVGKFYEALNAFEKSIEINPNSSATWFNMGMHYLFGRKLNILLLIYPDQTFGIVLVPNMIDHGNALVAFDRAIILNPKYVDAWHNKGLALGYLGMYEEYIGDKNNATINYKKALACETKATELNQTFVAALNHKGDLLAYLGEYQAAMDNYNKTLRIDPTNVTALWGLVNTNYHYLKNYQSAGTSLEKLTRIDPTDTHVWMILGLSYYMQCQYDKAMSSFDKILDLNPSDEAALSWRGEAIMQKESNNKKCATAS